MNENTEMMEQTNPAEEVEEITTDSDELELEFEAEEETEADTQEEEQPQQTPDEETNHQEEMFPGEFNVLGETKQVSMSEAHGLIQKGLAYDQMKDKYKGQLTTAYADPRIAFVEDLAKEAGVAASEYMANARMRKEYASLLETYGDLNNVPDNVMKMFTENAEVNRGKMEASIKEKAAAQEKRNIEEEFTAFMENHPELREIPQDVIELKVKGETLEGAFARVELAKAREKIRQLETQNKILTQNEKNKKTSLPTAKSERAKEDDLVWEFN